jgi:hypothetical protein
MTITLSLAKQPNNVLVALFNHISVKVDPKTKKPNELTSKILTILEKRNYDISFLKQQI